MKKSERETKVLEGKSILIVFSLGLIENNALESFFFLLRCARRGGILRKSRKADETSWKLNWILLRENFSLLMLSRKDVPIEERKDWDIEKGIFQQKVPPKDSPKVEISLSSVISRQNWWRLITHESEKRAKRANPDRPQIRFHQWNLYNKKSCCEKM